MPDQNVSQFQSTGWQGFFLLIDSIKAERFKIGFLNYPRLRRLFF
jgi:hypothetical protein